MLRSKIQIYNYVLHVLMRDEKEGRKNQAKSHKQQGKETQHTQGSQSLLLVKNELPLVGLEHTTLYTLDRALYHWLPRQHRWLGPNLTSHSTPDEQAYTCMKTMCILQILPYCCTYITHIYICLKIILLHIQLPNQLPRPAHTSRIFVNYATLE